MRSGSARPCFDSGCSVKWNRRPADGCLWSLKARVDPKGGEMQSGGSERLWDRALRLASLLPRHPGEFYDRMGALVVTRAERLWVEPGRYTVTPFERVLQELDHHLQGKVLEARSEPPFGAIEALVQQRVDAIAPVAPFPLMHNADYALARVAYVVCRALRPTVVLETGVAY